MSDQDDQDDEEFIRYHRVLAEEMTEAWEPRAAAAFRLFIDVWLTHRQSGTAGVAVAMGLEGADFMALLDRAEAIALSRPNHSPASLRADFAVVCVGFGYQLGLAAGT